MKKKELLNKTDNLEKQKRDTIYFAKLNDKAIIPTRRDEDGWYDLYACIDEDIIIPPHSSNIIPTGICSAFSEKYRIAFAERGSNINFNGILMAGKIDSGYRGEWIVAIYNGNDYTVRISNNVDNIQLRYTDNSNMTKFVPTCKAICQFGIEIVPQVLIKETDASFIKAMVSERGDGKLGSSGK